MKGKLKMIIIGIICIVWGCALFVSCSSSEGFDWKRLSLQKYEEKSFATAEDFEAVSIVSDTDNIIILPSADNTTKVEYTASNVLDYDIRVADGKLSIQTLDNRKWYHHINIYTPSITLTIYLPERQYQEFNIQAKTGDVTAVNSFTFGALNIHVSTGDLSLSNLTCDSVALTVSTGDISVSNFKVSGDFYADSSTGEKTFHNVSCNNATITASTGDLFLSNIQASGDVSVESSTGDQKYDNLTCNNATMISSTGDKTISTLTAFGNLTIQSGSGENSFNNIVCNELKVTTSTGRQTYADVSCGATELRADTGKIHMTNLVSSALLNITTDTGDILFDNCDAASMKIKADTGDVKGTFRTPKVIYADTDTGRVNIPHSAEGGLCEITTDTGSINIEFVG